MNVEKGSLNEGFVSLNRKSKSDCSSKENPIFHEYGKCKICTTESIGHTNPRNRSPLDIVVDASEGFIPLWKKGSILRWKFDENMLSVFTNPDEIKTQVRALFAEALLKWGDAVPVKFSENPNVWDFTIGIESDDNCSPAGCTLARAFFPDSGRHDLLLFPKMFEQTRKEQIDTLIHELGHVFGLRHFFANVREKAWPSEIFGEHRAFSIMNYGEMSELTEEDKSDLSLLYQLAWTEEITDINNTPIKFFTPFHSSF